MNYDDIVSHLQSVGYGAELSDWDGKRILKVEVETGQGRIDLIHLCTDELTDIPAFLAKDDGRLGKLAHVFPLPVGKKGNLCSVCVGDSESVSVNYDAPHLAFEDSVKRHVDLIKKLLEDPEWNQRELLREFSVNWSRICDTNKDLICKVTDAFQEMNVYSLVPYSHFIELASSTKLPEFSCIASINSLKNLTKLGTGLVLPLKDLQLYPRKKKRLSTG
uniref:Uncharacterized protein n=1 Tax=Candidatus Kentrum sp. LPFa TaxID=2126335 RepID=A0A450W2E3_9GAMM|nr:MAG: hypothetical protein BECKLPF1236B_GA0070989_10217 [Candidatus Kentron sp. LPFa]